MRPNKDLLEWGITLVFMSIIAIACRVTLPGCIGALFGVGLIIVSLPDGKV